MHAAYTQLTFTAHGLTLGGKLLAKRAANGAVLLEGQEASLQAVLIAAYGKPVSRRAMQILKQAGAMLKGVDNNAWDSRVPHLPEQVPVLAKAHMLLALSGPGHMEVENLPRLEDTLQALRKGVAAYELLDMRITFSFRQVLS